MTAWKDSTYPIRSHTMEKPVILFAELGDPVELPTNKTEVWRKILTKVNTGKRNYPPKATVK